MKPHLTQKGGMWYARLGGLEAIGLTRHCALKSFYMLMRK
jgi:hypothetical protein